MRLKAYQAATMAREAREENAQLRAQLEEMAHLHSAMQLSERDNNALALEYQALSEALRATQGAQGMLQEELVGASSRAQKAEAEAQKLRAEIERLRLLVKAQDEAQQAQQARPAGLGGALGGGGGAKAAAASPAAAAAAAAATTTTPVSGAAVAASSATSQLLDQAEKKRVLG